MSPEERACDLMNRYSLVWGLETASDRGLQSMIEAIATAIREAEDAAYERAYREIALTTIANIEGGSLDFINGLELAGKRIRYLKSQEP